MIVIVDYGMGNIGSILNMLKKAGEAATISSDVHEIGEADKLILPGVGAFDTGMRNLQALGLLEVLHDKVLNDKTPTLGICLGMQLLTKGSEEGTLPGLGWIEGETVRFRFNNQQDPLKVPHMGWNTIETCQESSLFGDLARDARFYFVHSFYVTCNEGDVLAKTQYGSNFVSAVHRENIWGTQFHPEKSHKYGMKVLKNFAEIDRDAEGPGYAMLAVAERGLG
jgi:imidazole glycerol-phosphate synthase subunit HisH